MKKTLTIIFSTVLIFVFLFGAPVFQTTDETNTYKIFRDNEIKRLYTTIKNPHKHGVDDDVLLHEELDDDTNEYEEYTVEDYAEAYIDTDCQKCLGSTDVDKCYAQSVDCLDLPDCTDWVACVGWCEAYEGDDDCYARCSDAFIDDVDVEVDLIICACEACGTDCRVLCGVKEGY